MTQEEQARLKVLNYVLEHTMSAKEAAIVLGLSERHTWRILADYRREVLLRLPTETVVASLPTPPVRAVRKQVLTLATTSYQGFNHTHPTEIQLCVIHHLRNSMKYVPYKDRKPLVKDLKSVY